MENLTQKNVGEIVAENYKTAVVFKNHKIDFCCRGNRSIQEVADKNGIKVDLLVKEIEAVLNQNNNETIDFKSWSLDLLIDYIEKKHHRYVESTIPVLNQYLDKLCNVHGDRHPELIEIREHFIASSADLAMHMKKEELVLFPLVRKMVELKQTHSHYEQSHCGTVQNPIGVMMQEHDNEGERFRTIEKLSNNYTPPEDACATYKVTYSLLKEFEADLHNHIHLENNILFPRAIELENEFLEI
jgi:regulator of cell morphogenesis and NO signaling